MNFITDDECGDCIVIRDLRIPARIGVYAEEKLGVQEVVMTLEFGLPNPICFDSDDVADTIDYAIVASRIKALALSRHFNLVESLAEHVSRLVIREFGALWIKVGLHKVGVVPGAASVGTTLRRMNVKKILGIARLDCVECMALRNTKHWMGRNHADSLIPFATHSIRRHDEHEP